MYLALKQFSLPLLLVCMGLTTVLVTCTQNTNPLLSNPPSNVTVEEGFGSQTIDLSGVFSDPDGDALMLTATSSNTAVATIAVAGTVLTLTEVGLGSTTITVTATDPSSASANASFTLEITETPNELPTVTAALSDLTLDEGFGTRMVDVGRNFADAETQMLIFTATSSATNVVTVSVEGPRLTITEAGVGEATITVTATDEAGASVSDAFDVQVMAGVGGNNPPQVANALADVSYTTGFRSETISLASVFSDADGDALTYSATSANTSVVSVSVNGTTLTITEAGEGNTTITVTADDGNGGTASDTFTVEVGISSCANDNSIDTSNRATCDLSPTQANEYEESVANDVRTIVTNRYPNHDHAENNPTANAINDEQVTLTIDATPVLANAKTNITNNGRPAYKFGVALNGVPYDPAPGEPFIFEDTQTGEYNWDWVFEPNYNLGEVALDCASAHVQPDGTYHYHGDPLEYVETVLDGVTDGSTVPTEAVHVGWAADGFPIVYRYGPNANGSFGPLNSSYQIKSGNRPGDGVSEPCGEYNGKYTADFEYVQGAGDLDECNGIEQRITIKGETFSYFYVLTDSFPFVPRCISGVPDDTFKLGPP